MVSEVKIDDEKGSDAAQRVDIAEAIGLAL
jgi:hypothetical protein